ncbi:MAG: DUF1343 domain-containing protein [Verrucomicrobia bacterium]|nr:DUF1343 domain-containing protein [Verrucomicrobiota bacterium]
MSVSLGIENLLENQVDRLEGRRVGLVAHPASVDSHGTHSAELLWLNPEINLTALFGPEHGFFGRGGAGEDIGDQQHTHWDIPVFSLYGDTRKPTAEMMDAVDVIVFDLQDVGVRCYTYVSTLKLVLESASETGKSVIVCDRPNPLANTVDGPMLDANFESFVGCIPSPLVYGMTSGETALWLRQTLSLDVDLHVAGLGRYTRTMPTKTLFPSWRAPSPALRSIEAAWCYPATVWCEALPSIDCNRSGPLPFQVVGAPWIKGEHLVAAIGDVDGASLEPLRYIAIGKPYDGWEIEGVRIVVRDSDAFRPAGLGIRILSFLEKLHGTDKLWGNVDARHDFFDKLMGTDGVRLALKDGEDPRKIVETWSTESFDKARSKVLLY